MTFLVGLTGSIGMGKSTTAEMFADEGIPVWDADAVVHRLYAPNGLAVEAVARLFPSAVTDDRVDRETLKSLIDDDPTVLDQLQSVVHPLVAADREAFIANHSGQIILLDIPLLFETGADKLCDAIVVVSVDAKTQRARVLARGEMTEAQFKMILSRQTPDSEKRLRADYIIETTTLDAARAQVRTVIGLIREKADA